MTSSQSSQSTGVASRGDSALVSSLGKTTIAETVVSKIAGIATREVDGLRPSRSSPADQCPDGCARGAAVSWCAPCRAVGPDRAG